MKLQEIFDQLTSGELSQLSIGGLDAGVIDEANWQRVINHINLGLGALGARFPLKESELLITLQEGQLVYPLHSDYSVHSLRRPGEAKFIQDTTTARFKDDILKVTEVYADSGMALGLNDRANGYAVSTPSVNVLRVPLSIVANDEVPVGLETDSLRIAYRASLPQIMVPLGYFDPTRTEVELPYSYLTALLYFVASRVNNPVGMSNEFHAGNSWYGKYENECQLLETQGLRVDQGSQPDRLQRNGWV